MQSTLRPNARAFTVALFKEPIMAGSHTAQAKEGAIRREASSQIVRRKSSSWPEIADQAMSGAYPPPNDNRAILTARPVFGVSRPFAHPPRWCRLSAEPYIWSAATAIAREGQKARFRHISRETPRYSLILQTVL